MPAFPPSGRFRLRFDGQATAAVLLVLAIPASIAMGRAASGIAIGLALVALLAALVTRRSVPPLPVQSRPILLVSAAVALTWLPAVALSLKPLVSLATLAQILACVVLGLLTHGLCGGGGRDRIQAVFLAAFTGALTVTTIALTVAPGIIGFRAPGPVVAPMILKAAASIVACALPVALLLGRRLGGRWWWCALAALPLGGLLMVATHSKSSLAGLAGAGLVAALLVLTRPLGWPARIAAWIATAGAAAASLLWALGFTAPVVMGGFSRFAPTWLVDAHRQVIWQFTLSLWTQRPWAGWGLNVINDAPGAGNKIPELYYEFIPSHPHDWVVQVLSEAGLIGFLPFLAVVLGVLLVLVRRWYAKGETVILAALCLWVTFWSAGLFNFSLWNAWWESSLAILMALTFTATARDDRR